MSHPLSLAVTSSSVWYLFLALSVVLANTGSSCCRALSVKPQASSSSSSSSSSSVASVAQDWIQKNRGETKKATTPLTNTALFLPPDRYDSDQATFLQRITNTRIEGYSNIENACQEWESCFQTDDLQDVDMNLRRVSMVSSTTLVAQWNVTWVPPTAMWLEYLAKANNWSPVYCSYVHLADQVSTFSYKAVGKLLWDAVTTQELRIPLACIEGTTTCEFTPPSSQNGDLAVVKRITEELAYAQDLRRGALKNRKCAQDLKLFLESGRRYDKNNDWDDVVATCLPWQSVPGMNPLDIDPNSSDEAMVPILFLSASALALVGFAALVAPELIGQSLFGPPTYIVPPSELNSIIAY